MANIGHYQCITPTTKKRAQIGNGFRGRGGSMMLTNKLLLSSNNPKTKFSTVSYEGRHHGVEEKSTGLAI